MPGGTAVGQAPPPSVTPASGQAGAEMYIPLPQGAVHRLGRGWTTVVACSPEGDTLAIGTSLGIELRKTRDLELRGFLPNQASVVLALALTRDGRLLAGGVR